MNQAELNKLLSPALKRSGKIAGWGCSRGFLFKATGPLFFSLIVLGRAKEFRLSYSLSYKLLEFDEVFWAILKMEENRKPPLSFRGCGAWVAPTMIITAGELETDEWCVESVDKGLETALDRCDREAQQVVSEITGIDDNLHFIERLYARLKEKYPGAVTNIWRERLLTAILNKDHARAESIAQSRIGCHDSGGFKSGNQSFYELAIEYLQRVR